MIKKTRHDQTIAKIQHFAEMLRQCQLEKEALVLVLNEPNLTNSLKDEISVYQQIILEYYALFDDILYKE